MSFPMKNDKMEEELAELSCPFTWSIEKTLGYAKEQDVFEETPLKPLIMVLLDTYVHANKEELPEAMRKLEECENCLSNIQEQPSTGSRKALSHILEATKCNLLYKSNRVEEAEALLGKITPVRNMDDKDHATLLGCQSIAWSEYYEIDNMKVIKLAREAIRLDPNNYTWHFYLAKNLRRLRRRGLSTTSPGEEEIKEYKKVYELSQSPTHLVTLAQLYIEMRDNQKAKEIYERLFDLNLECWRSRAQLAHGFIRLKDKKRARDCLDYIATRVPDNLMYLHYEAIYEEKCNNDFVAALKYYRRAVDGKNFGAVYQYIRCRMKLEQEFELLPYLLSLLKKFEDSPPIKIQEIYLQIGACYLFVARDLPTACSYYVKGIEMDPKNTLLQKQFVWSPIPKLPEINVYHLLANEIHLVSREGYDAEVNATFAKTLKLCQDNCSDIPDNPRSSDHTYHGYTAQGLRLGRGGGRGGGLGGARDGGRGRGTGSKYVNKAQSEYSQ